MATGEPSIACSTVVGVARHVFVQVTPPSSLRNTASSPNGPFAIEPCSVAYRTPSPSTTAQGSSIEGSPGIVTGVVDQVTPPSPDTESAHRPVVRSTPAAQKWPPEVADLPVTGSISGGCAGAGAVRPGSDDIDPTPMRQPAGAVSSSPTQTDRTAASPGMGAGPAGGPMVVVRQVRPASSLTTMPAH